MRLNRSALFAAIIAVLLSAASAAYVWLDRWQRGAIFSIELGEARWAREPLPGTEIFDLPLSGGQTIRAWYVSGPSPDAPTVLYLHGSRWNLNSSVFRMERWVDMGYSMLAIDYRGFGESTELLPSQASAVEDAQAALRELERRQPDPARRFVYGHSLGGAVAVALAADAEPDSFAGLILESTFTSIREMIAASRWRNVPGLHWIITQPFDSLSRIAHVRQPILFIHGTGDSVVPHAMSDALYEAASGRDGGKQSLAKIESASHSGASRSPGYAEAVREFTGEVVTEAGSPPL